MRTGDDAVNVGGARGKEKMGLWFNHKLDDLVFWLKVGVGAITAWFLSWPEVLRVLAILQVLDIATGIMVAYQNKTIASYKARDGVLRKALSWVLILVVALLQDQLSHYFPVVVAGMTPFGLVAAIFAVGEAISIVENANAAGVPIPAFVTNALDTAKHKLDPKEE
jgi:toxin secretion/phage lysis holin